MRKPFYLSFGLILAGLGCLAQAQVPMTGAGKGAPGGGGACSFPTLTNLIGRYRADTGVTTSSGNVTAVTDQSGAANNLFNVGTVPFNATSAYNSHPAFDFANANDAALVTGNTVLAGATTLPDTTLLSAFFVGRMNSATPSFGSLLGLGVTPDPDYANANDVLALNRDGSSAAIESTYVNVNYNSSAMSTSANHRFGVIMASSTITLFVDGVDVNGTPAAFPGMNLASPTNVILGNHWQPFATGLPWDGPILEVVIATSDITSQVGALDTYFTCQYGT